MKAKQLDDGIGDTLVAVGTTSGIHPDSALPIVCHEVPPDELAWPNKREAHGRTC